MKEDEESHKRRTSRASAANEERAKETKARAECDCDKTCPRLDVIASIAFSII
jgi:hypothetical protein